MTIQSLSKDEVRVRFEGDTWSFKSNFTKLGVPGRYETSDGVRLSDDPSLLEKKRAFFVRIIKKWDVSNEDKAEFLVDMLRETIYENTLVAVKWIGDIKESTPVAELKKNVNELENVYTPE